MNNTKQTIYLFWTGGWDSTFRLLQLAEQNIIIQPIYVISEPRLGRKQEQTAMKKILNLIKSSNKFIAEIKDILIYKQQDIIEKYYDEAIIKSSDFCHEKYNLGEQYGWLSLLAKHLNIKIEMGILFGERSKVDNFFKKEGKIIELDDGRKVVDIHNSSENVINLFSNVIFPIAGYTKTDILKFSKQKDWYDIMSITWFCHTPKFGLPCGRCNPCKDAMNEGMNFRMPKISKLMYHYHSYKESLKNRIKILLKIDKKQ